MKKYQEVAKELNQVLGIEPAIDIKAPQKEVEAKIQEAAEMIVPEDNLSDATIAYLTEKGWYEIAEKVEVEETPAKKEKIATAQKSAKKEKSVKKEKLVKKVGVIATIVKAIEDADEEGISKDEIHALLVKNFPERDPESMRKTVNVQVPGRISKEKFEVKKLENGKFVKA